MPSVTGCPPPFQNKGAALVVLRAGLEQEQGRVAQQQEGEQS